MLQNGVSHRYVCVKEGTKGGYRTPVGGLLGWPRKYRAIRGYRSDTIAISRDMGPLRWSSGKKIYPKSLGPAFSLCRHVGIDAALVKAQFSFRMCNPNENKIEQKL